MTRWLAGLLLGVLLLVTPSLAWDIPYGVQDPMHSPGFPPCVGGEVGYWQVISRAKSDRSGVQVYLVLTTVDFMDPAFVICWVDGQHRVQAIGPEAKL